MSKTQIKIKRGESTMKGNIEKVKALFHIQKEMRLPKFDCWVLDDDKWTFEDNQLKYVTKPNKTADRQAEKQGSD